MGVPGFVSFLSRKYPRCIRKNTPPDVYGLFIDTNGIVHDANKNVSLRRVYKPAQREDYERDIHIEVVSLIRDIVKNVTPQSLLYIALDGVAPQAKIHQQSQRRYMASLHREGVQWDTNAITTGTKFMADLGYHLKHSHILNSLAPKIVVSTDKDPGEGEHKIVRNIRKLHDENKDADANFVIHGLDADIILLSLAMYPASIHIIRHSSNHDEKNHVRQSCIDIKSLANEIHHKMLYHINRHKRASMQSTNAIVDDVAWVDTSSNGPQTVDNAKKGLIYDFIVLTMFMGNDFIPKSYSLDMKNNELDVLLTAYTRARMSVPGSYDGVLADISENETNTATCRDRVWTTLLREIALRENKRVSDRMKRECFQFKFPHGHSRQERIEFYGDYHRTRELAIAFDQKDWRTRYYKVANIPHPNVSASKYMNGIRWNIRYYYIGGESIDGSLSSEKHSWMYEWNHAPSFLDILRVTESRINSNLPLFDSKFVERKQRSPIDHLVSVLPYQSISLLPSHIREKIKVPHGQFQKPIEIDAMGAIYLWECKPSHVHTLKFCI